MRAQDARQRFSRVRLVAPIVLILFALGWYRFSVVYIQAANDQLVLHNNLAVYVPIQQVSGYLTALDDATEVIVLLGLLILTYNVVSFVRLRGWPRGSAEKTDEASARAA